MPTQDWFKANPKVSAYLSTELNQALQSWMKEHRIKKVSVGLTTILESFLGVNQDKLPVDQSSVSLEQFQELQQRIETLEQTILKVDQSKPKVEQKSLEIKVEPQKNEPKRGVDQSKPKSSPKIGKEISDKTVSQGKPISSPTQNTEWLTTKEAYTAHASDSSYETFRKLKPQQLLERFGLEADINRKKEKGKRWIRKPLQAD